MRLRGDSRRKQLQFGLQHSPGQQHHERIHQQVEPAQFKHEISPVLGFQPRTIPNYSLPASRYLVNLEQEQSKNDSSHQAVIAKYGKVMVLHKTQQPLDRQQGNNKRDYKANQKQLPLARRKNNRGFE